MKPAYSPQHRSADAGPIVGLDDDAFPLAFHYSPGSHSLLSPKASYQATPAEPASKYLLASPDRGQGRGRGGSGALEYVPKAVSQPQRHNHPTFSGKYVVDNSRPPTDLEYDPLSNYSARHPSRTSYRDKHAAKQPRVPRGSKPYTPAPKKPCDPIGSCDATFSDSEDEAAMVPSDEPTTASTPKARADPESKASGQPPSKESLEAEGGSLRETKETAVQCNVGDLQPTSAKPSSPAQALQDGGCPKEEKLKRKKSGAPSAPSCRDARPLDEGASQDSPKQKRWALSHTDLFEDESEDEATGLGERSVPSVWPPQPSPASAWTQTLTRTPAWASRRHRGLAPSSVSSLSKASGRRVVSYEVVLRGRLAAKTSFSLSCPSSPRGEDVKVDTLYSRLKEYLLTQDQLKENRYPFLHPERPGGCAIIFTAEKERPNNSSCRTCCRCGTEYFVSSSSRSVRDEKCYYHWGQLRWSRVAGGWETQYMCCPAADGSVGCRVAKQQVQDGRKEHPEGFLTLVTVADTDVHVVYDTFVKPDNVIVDYNIRFSGVMEANLADTSVTLHDVQAVLLSMFSANTILIGHSLQSDLLALKVIHSTIVDTSVLFPHLLGLPCKRSLRNLMADYLRQISRTM
ncbi:hypothetical protein P7K49_022489 [Saguinus oedipus]|uniref:RNA exonuclease 1 homolog-like domain-containing protein n=1 Tax=Saguinus oedipus TaxID=9490 RepID=A0ABQ9UVM0_SAGOE|nr:hypothetical protein P7K49_022489 [Saguinus oedipus]